MAKYQKYAEYQDSGVKWLGLIPKHWSSYLFKRVVSGIKDGTHGTHARVENGELLLSAKNVFNGGLEIGENESYIPIKDYKEITSNGFPQKGDILVTCVGTIGRSFVYPFDKSLAFQRSVSFIRLNKKGNAQFYKYFIESKAYQSQLESLVKSSAQGGIYMGDLINTVVINCPLDEQVNIANFLDYETAQIDTLIAKQEKLIELLKEKRQAVISHAVTKGLNSDVSMKDSGVEWLGQVPEHWTVTKVGFHALKIGSGKTPKGGAEIYQDEGVLFIRSQNVYNDGLRIDNSESVYITEAIHDDMSTSKVYSGDILLNITGGSIGRSSLVPENFPEANVNQHVCIIRVRKYLQDFLALVIQSDLIQAQLRSIQTGGNREGLNFEQISKFWFTLPSNEEQQQIISYIKNKLNEFGELEARANKAIQLMQERRTALISAAVTGKIDVRNWQNPNKNNEANTELGA